MKKKHAFFHTLVISSVSVMDGCGISHGTNPGTDTGPLPDGNQTSDAWARSAAVFDAGPVLDVILPDAGSDSFVADDAGSDVFQADDAGSDVFQADDAGPDVFAADASTAHRFCAPGWPPTKGVRVCQIIDEEGAAVLRCVYTWGEEMEVDWQNASVCNAVILDEDERWFGDGDRDAEMPREFIGCTPIETDACRLVDEGGRQLLVCTDATCELSEELVGGTSR